MSRQEEPTLLDLAIAMAPRMNDDLAAGAPKDVPPPTVWMMTIAMYLQNVRQAFEARDYEAWKRETVMLTAAALGFCGDTDERIKAIQRRGS